MNIELLGFGNITVAALTLVLTFLFITGVYQIGMMIGRFVLSLDHENAPNMLKSNYLWGKVHNIKLPTLAYLLVNDRGQYYDHSDGTTSYHKYLRCYYYKKVEKKGYTNIASIGGIFVANVGILLLIDLAIFWLQAHFLSAVWALSTVGIALSLRFITNKIWNHSGRITKLEEK